MVQDTVTIITRTHQSINIFLYLSVTKLVRWTYPGHLSPVHHETFRKLTLLRSPIHQVFCLLEETGEPKR